MKQLTHVGNKFKDIVKNTREIILNIKLNNNGFTLIEAIITIAIVGIIVTPISMVFFGSLNDTVEAKEMLKANQMAQLYVENLKIRSYEEIEELFLAGDTLILDEDSIASGAYLIGLPAIPQNFRVELIIDRTLYESVPEFEINKPPEADEITSGDADVYVDIDYSTFDKPTIYFYHYTDLENAFHSIEFDSSSGIYEFDFLYSQGKLFIIKTDTPTILIDDDVIDGIELNPTGDDIIVINAGVLKEDILDFSLNDTEVIIHVTEMNNTTCSAFILRESEDYVSPIIETENGLVLTNYNIMERNPAEFSIGKIIINVINNNTNEVLATMSATKLYD